MSNYCNIYMDGYYVAPNAPNVRYLNFNGLLKYHKINILRNLTINNKISKNAKFAPYKC